MTVEDITTTTIKYQPLDQHTLVNYLSQIDSIRNSLIDPSDTWEVAEVGDGNLNLVFTVKSKHNKLIVKQAVPYLRLVGEGWPLPLKRSFFEATALTIEAKHVPQIVPKLHHVDNDMALIVMEFCSPHIILRKGFIQGTYYPNLSEHIGVFLAETLFKTSDLYLPANEKKKLMATFCDNIALCKITEDLVFTHPYIEHPQNRWTTPELDDMKEEFEIDPLLKIASQEMKEKFLTQAQALIHGDLHSGSVMVTDTDTKVIDPEFAFFGPMGFDIGAYIGNLFLAYFSQPGHTTQDDDREDYAAWLNEQVVETWFTFQTSFTTLWNTEAKGDCYAYTSFEDPAALVELTHFQRRYFDRLLQDTLGFAAVKMIRRILGLAHVEDMESIKDTALRAECETQALLFARELLLNRHSFHSIMDVTTMALDF